MVKHSSRWFIILISAVYQKKNSLLYSPHTHRRDHFYNLQHRHKSRNHLRITLIPCLILLPRSRHSSRITILYLPISKHIYFMGCFSTICSRLKIWIVQSEGKWPYPCQALLLWIFTQNYLDDMTLNNPSTVFPSTFRCCLLVLTSVVEGLMIAAETKSMRMVLVLRVQFALLDSDW